MGEDDGRGGWIRGPGRAEGSEGSDEQRGQRGQMSRGDTGDGARDGEEGTRGYIEQSSSSNRHET